MLHDILFYFLCPSEDRLSLMDILVPDVCRQYLHPSEFAILEDIVKISKEYKEIKNFISQYSRGKGCTKRNVTDEDSLQKGLYLQAFADGVEQSLQTFAEKIVLMEERYLKSPDLTLMFVYHEIQQFQPLFNYLQRLISAVKAQRLHGCAVVQYLQRHSLCFSDNKRRAIKIIQHSVNYIFLKQLSQWLIYGKCTDVYGEFFIQNVGNVVKSPTEVNQPNRMHHSHGTSLTSDGTSSNTELWRYEICYDLLPQYITATCAEKILFIGQTVVMFNNDPQDAIRKANTWNQDDRDLLKPIASLWNNQEHTYLNRIKELQSDDQLGIGRLEEIIDSIKCFVTNRLSEIALNQADLIAQLRVIKDLYLLGRGEMFLEFIKQTNRISESHPTGQINETIARDIAKAFQSSANSVNFIDDMDQFSLNVATEECCLADSIVSPTNLGSHFIENMTLRYKVKWPLFLLFSPKVLQRYNDMFRFLLRIKKAQYDLHMIWCHHREKKMAKNSNSLQFRNKLMFLIDNLQYYLQVDVLEGQFSILMNTVQNSKDFEEIQRAHLLFQANILSLCFLLGTQEINGRMNGSMTNSTLTGTNGTGLLSENPVLIILNKILRQVDVFYRMSFNCGDEMSKDEQDLLDRCDILLANNIDDLLKLLTGLKAGPSSAPLSQLLLRLDFNYYFSSQKTKKLDAN